MRDQPALSSIPRARTSFGLYLRSPLSKPRIHAEPGLALNTSFPNKCRHCNPAPCMGACPTAAIRRSEDYPEIVLIDGGKCIACGMCAMVCPFDVITYFPSAEAPETDGGGQSATLSRPPAEGAVPACVEACKVGALAIR